MLEQLKRRFFALQVVRKTIRISKILILPGFDKLPIYFVAKFFIKGIRQGLLDTKASSMAFRFFMALFPTLIFLLTLLPYIPIPDFKMELLKLLEDLLPESGYLFVEETVVDLVTDTDGGLLSFGFIFAIFLATNGIDSMLLAFEDSINVSHNRNFFHKKLLSIQLLFILTFLIIIAIGAILFSVYLVNFVLEKSSIASILLLTGKWIIMAAICFFAISFIYYIGGNRKLKWRFFSAGSTLATLMVLLVSLGFGYYVDNFANYDKIYGSIGTIIVIMLWIYFNSFVLLVGFELNASIQQAGSIKALEDKIEEK
ncbi:YihY/virulence factor BrkB family protein [Vicingaceae bacterium]|nr:YihY/virulence factor BrkB family protein [Vicingaceae bacterium]MDC1451101.1 YihY/virulence factor BrkB family protein [Vicingaceae bacterium]